MSQIFNADEIFNIGIEIEKNGEKFYETAVALTDNEKNKKMFTQLAKMEKDHILLFENLMQKAGEDKSFQDAFDPDNQAHSYLKAIADAHIFLSNQDIPGMVKQCATAEEVLKMAITFEKDSVVLYSSMKKIVPENLGRDKIDWLIEEEIKHVVMLSKQLHDL
jgi:rubrerythrin